MHTLFLTPDRRGEHITETFADAGLKIVSRSGLHPVEAVLMGWVHQLRNPGRMLVVGNRTAGVALAAARLHEGCHPLVHEIDLHHARTAQRNVAMNRAEDSVEVVCESRIGRTGEFDSALVQLCEGDQPGELVQEWIDDVRAAVKPGGRVVVAAERPKPWLIKHLKEAFGAGPTPLDDGLVRIAGSSRGPDPDPKNREASFTMSLPGGARAVDLITIPGVFSHRRVDEGAQALAEMLEPRPGDRLLDMGCGSGAVGVVTACNAALDGVTFVDGSARAVDCARANALRNGLAEPLCEFVLSDDGLPGAPRFTLFAGNPPYFSQHQIDELFIQTARRMLLPGGRAFFVAKNATWIHQRVLEVFSNAELLSRRGYGIVAATL